MKLNFVNSNPKSPQKTPAFQSRNANLRFADQIMRVTKNEFPMLSDTRIYNSLTNKNKITRQQAICLTQRSEKILALRDYRPKAKADPIGYIKKLLFDVKVTKLGNCGENGSLGKIGLAVNGIKNVKKASLCVYDSAGKGVSLDHSFNIVNLSETADLKRPSTYGRKAYIVDLWDGVVDTVENTFKRFEAEYSGDRRIKGTEIRKPKTEEEKLKKKTIGINIDNDFEVDDTIINLVSRVFPNLKIKSPKT